MTELTLKYKSVAEQFSIEGEILSIEPYGSGHINTTFLLVTDKKRYILQKMNTDIFSDSDALMKNICLAQSPFRSLRTPVMMPGSMARQILFDIALFCDCQAEGNSNHSVRRNA